LSGPQRSTAQNPRFALYRHPTDGWRKVLCSATLSVHRGSEQSTPTQGACATPCARTKVKISCREPRWRTDGDVHAPPTREPGVLLPACNPCETISPLLNTSGPRVSQAEVERKAAEKRKAEEERVRAEAERVAREEAVSSPPAQHECTPSPIVTFQHRYRENHPPSRGVPKRRI
jgi:hypothetical protein